METSFEISPGIRISIRNSVGLTVVGRPGSGKSWLLNYIMLSLMKNCKIYPLICDTKLSDLYNLKRFMKRGNPDKRVAGTPSQVAGLLRRVTKLMDERYSNYNSHWGADWVDAQYMPVLLICDEYSSTIAQADRNTAKEIENYMKQLVFKARQLGGIYILLASQRITADTLSRNVTSSMSVKIAMERLDSISLNLAFPECNVKEIPYIDNIPGHALIYSDTFPNNVPIPIIAPDLSNVEVPKVFETLDERAKCNDYVKEDYWPFD